ncbi:Transcriptional regulator, XRE family [Roseovarius sp. EC-HK134]|uniref:helix-turn-helix domain-containing protein n=1 Tax=unclassified Roseovarius TaxID=2614913 RepID=UPI001256F173|nr:MULTISPECIES: helix-turn-helix domain-containing protein [unclassified Roseovarius]VVT19874.1 Transcriptional regulator, XRE family [Roseovarius sp. EC-SD190]VVT20021.1 Transcriptional regulator, XRE family [Roseovarius sp. EC-HK134]
MSGSKIINGLHEALDHASGFNSPAVDHTVLVHKIDVRAVRESLRLTQEEFALRFGFNLGTLRGWEQGRRQPDGTARVLLKVIQNAPDAVERALSA